MHTNRNYCEYRVKTLNWSCNHVRRRNYQWVWTQDHVIWLQKVKQFSRYWRFNNNILPRSLSVNVKEASEIFLITLWWPNKLSQMYTRSHTYIKSRVKGSHHFRAENGLKKIFYGKTIFNEKIYFSCSSSPLAGSKSWQWPKVDLEAVK